MRDAPSQTPTAVATALPSQTPTAAATSTPTTTRTLSLSGTVGEISSVAFSRDGTTLAAGSNTRSVQVWDVATGRLRRTLSSAGDITGVAFSPDGKSLAASTDVSQRSAGVVLVWDVASGRLQHTFSAKGALSLDSGSMIGVAFSPDGRTLAAGNTFAPDGAYNAVLMWDVASGRLRRILADVQDRGPCSTDCSSPNVTGVTFSPDGTTLAAGSTDTTIELWNVASGQLRTLSGHTNTVESAAFSPDGTLLASGSDDRTIGVWSVATGRLVHTLTGHGDDVTAVAFNADGTLLASGSWDRTIRLWTVRSGQYLRTLRGHADSVTSLAFSPDGRMLASGSGDNTVGLWAMPRGGRLGTFPGPCCAIGAVSTVAFSPDGRTLVSHDDAIRLWDVAGRRPLRTLTRHGNDATGPHSVAFSPDGTTLATCDNARSTSTVELWDVATGRLRRTLHSSMTALVAVAFSPDGKTLAVGGGQQGGAAQPQTTLELWDVAGGRLRHRLAGYRVLDVAFSPDGKTVATATNSGTPGRDLPDPNGQVWLWDVASGQQLAVFGDPGAGTDTTDVNSVAFSPDGKTLAAGSNDSTVRLWTLASGGITLTTAHAASVQDVASRAESVAFSPDGKTLAAGCDDGTLLLWRVVGRRLDHKRTLSGHTQSVNSVSFSPDGTMLASGSADRTIRLWSAVSGNLLFVLPAG